jgi:hypothetical protein
MEVEINVKEKKKFNLKTLHVNANARYWENSTINGFNDTERGDLIPCKENNSWKPIIDIDNGIILNWEKGKVASIHYKVVDCCRYEIHDDNGKIIKSVEDGYVPRTLSPKRNGYGDYIIMDIDENGLINNWIFKVDDFFDEEDE